MARETRYKYKADYKLLKKRHQLATNGTIYEEDYMTINQFSDMYDKSVPLFNTGDNSSVFKFNIPETENVQSKHIKNDWVKRESSLGGECSGNSEIWTLSCIDKIEDTTENRIEFKPDYSSLLSFAYYGSAIDMVRASMNDLITNFPGEIYFSENKIIVSNEAGNASQCGGGGVYNTISNPFGIDFIHDGKYEVENNLRLILNEFAKYEILDENQVKISEIDNITSSMINSGQKPLECYEKGVFLGIITVNGNNVTLSKSNNNIDGTLTYSCNNTIIGTFPENESENAESLLLEDENGVLSKLDYFGQNRDANEVVITLYIGPMGTESGDYRVEVEEKPKTIKAAAPVQNDNSSQMQFFVFYKDGYTSLLYKDENYAGRHIRLKEEIVNSEYNKFDDFERILINRQSNPLYTSKWETPFEDEDGFYKYKIESYTIITDSGKFNPDILSVGFERYIERMLSLASYYDNNRSDILWRLLTHESMKKLPWKFTEYSSQDDFEDIGMDTSRIEGAIKIYGRVFDDIKRSIDLLKNINNISYNQKNNVPDYFLSDYADNCGLTRGNLNITNDNDIVTEPLYPTKKEGYTSYDANLMIHRLIKINANYLSSIKGTRNAIETILAILGFDVEDYTIEEKVCVAQGWNKGEIYSPFSATCGTNETRYPSLCNVMEINQRRSSKRTNVEGNELDGLPVAAVTVTSGESEFSYIIPWFDKDTQYDDDMYFQMKGGWGKKPSLNGINGNNFYSETQQYMRYANSLSEMLRLSNNIVKKGDVCYVSDISEIYDNKIYIPKSGDTLSNASNYFVLMSELNYLAGYSESIGEYGWKNISTTEIEAKQTDVAKKILYMESIIDDSEGNNPHCGYGNYDNGCAYIEKMDRIFQYGIDTNDFNTYDIGNPQMLSAVSFNMKDEIDNGKCWYFAPDDYTCSFSGKDGTTILLNDFSDYTMKPINPENGDNNTEVAANSILNVKNIKLTFYPKSFGNEEENNKYLNFIEKNVLEYVKMIIPSTCIFEYDLNNFKSLVLDNDRYNITNIGGNGSVGLTYYNRTDERVEYTIDYSDKLKMDNSIYNATSIGGNGSVGLTYYNRTDEEINYNIN